MNVSEYYSLPFKQPSLEFVDVNVSGDTRVYIDPKAIKDLGTPWGQECVALLQTFFSEVIRAIQNEDYVKAKGFLSFLSEPNETRLGVSKGKPRGRGVGEILSTDILDALINSEAAESGLLEDLEDTALLIEGVGYDLISDMTTNIIRSQLIDYTQKVQEKYPSISLEEEVYAGAVWDRHANQWSNGLHRIPVAAGKPLLLVPKSIVRRNKLTFDPGEYMTHFILPKLVNDELTVNSSLVHVLKTTRERKVYKKDVKIKHGIQSLDNSNNKTPPRPLKDLSLEVTLENPEILDKYRTEKKHSLPALGHSQLTEVTGENPVDWDELLNGVLSIPAGRPNAHKYHLAVEALFKALFWPALDYMRHEYEIDPSGLKRVDITFDNIAREGFFDWVNRVVGAPAHEVYFECKNYIKDVANPELDQIRGRFSNQSSNLGFMVFRKTSDKTKIIEGCRNTAVGGHGYIIALDDDDLKALVDEKKRTGNDAVVFQYLRNRYSELV